MSDTSKKSETKKLKYKLSEESAEDVFDSLLDYYDIEESDIKDKDQRSAFKTSKAKITRAIRKGQIEIADGYMITQHLTKPPGDVTTIEYGELSGRSKLAMGKVDDDDNYARIHALLGSLSGMGSKAIASLKGKDMSLAECLGTIFLIV